IAPVEGALAIAEPVTPLPASGVVVESDTIGTWRAILERVRAKDFAIASTLELAIPVVVSKERLVLAFEEASFEDDVTGETDSKAVLTAEARAFFGATTLVA